MPPTDTTCYFVYITTSGNEEAILIGQALVDDKLAACANIVDGMESIYRWEGKVVQDHETVLIAKTTGAKLEALEARVKMLHSYDVPCIVAMPIAFGSKEYLDWIRAEVRGEI
ncbi:MAG: divalent-cation tolerance protein CutA [Rhodothermaceae bacterium]|nr:divalent-cation tolerance protein CutA [Rhodothermaceae bacterium]